VNGSLALNLLALVISVIALGVSVVLGRRQLKLARDSHLLPIISDIFKETRSEPFMESMAYIRDRLAELPADNGYRYLPGEGRVHIRRVGLFFDDIGKLVAHHIVEENIVLGAYGGAIQRIWDIVAPYVYSERQKYNNMTMFYFEDLASRAGATAMRAVHGDLGLRSRPPAQ
jgi:hypothetical protein